MKWYLQILCLPIALVLTIYRGVQVYYGLKSHCINVYEFRSKGEFPSNYKDFICEHGAPSALWRYNALEEQSESFSAIHCELYIKDEWSEPYHQHQNPVES